ncbi:MAG: hypothetical protein LZF62_380174 [Nitrospira sp.]|nr:MAG: hypothetical protein LZF62_380174 [Nitrospira sp.]
MSQESTLHAEGADGQDETLLMSIANLLTLEVSVEVLLV